MDKSESLSTEDSILHTKDGVLRTTIGRLLGVEGRMIGWSSVCDMLVVAPALQILVSALRTEYLYGVLLYR